jgi:hypothetical protein
MSRYSRYPSEADRTTDAAFLWRLRRTTGPSVLLLAVLAIPHGARAQVDCGDANNLCTGDPCIVPALELPATCVVDFGARALRITGRLTVPSGGTVSFTAASITVQAPIGQRQTYSGSTVALTASGDIDVHDDVTASGTPPGTTTLNAGGHVVIDGQLRAIGHVGPSSITVTAGSDIDVRKKIDGTAGGGGNVALTAGGNVTLAGTIRIGRANANAAGSIIVMASGVLAVYHPVKVLASSGHVTLHGDGGVMLGAPVRAGKFDASLDVASSAGEVQVTRTITARTCLGCFGPTVTVTAATDATLDAPIVANPNGHVTVTAGGVATVNQLITAAALPANLALPGLIRIDAGSVAVTSGARLDSSGVPGGAIRIQASAGDCALNGDFMAHGASGAGGIIEASASGNLVAEGRFLAAPDGCIALTAGGMLDTSGASFDEPILADCPGS